jgi:hypothetical protein
MVSIRRALSDHMDTMRAVVLAGTEVDTGTYDVRAFVESLHEPGRGVQLETTWIHGLLDLLHLIERYVRLVDRWTSHVAGLMQNLGATEDEIAQAQRMQLTVAEMFRRKHYDPHLLRWILADLSEEVDRLVAESQDLVSETPRLVKLADQFGGPFLEQVKQIALVWMSEGRREFYLPLIHTLQQAHAAQTSDDLLLKLVSYLQQIRTLVASTPMFMRASNPAPYSSDALKATHQLVKQLAKGIEDLTTFVALRTQTYVAILQHEEALIQAVLPPSAKASEWIARHALERAQPTAKLLPKALITDTLPLAVEQAADALAQVDAKTVAARPFFEGALRLNDLLQSPAAAKFLAADDRRLEVYREWRPRIAASFARFRVAVKSGVD